MESRKYHLQKQIIDALKANDSNLYSLLKSQWAHRFGVESLEELENLDLNQLNQNPNNLNNQNIDKPEEDSFDVDEPNNINNYDTKEKEIITKEFKPNKDGIDESFKIKSYDKVNKENDGYKAKSSIIDNKINSEIEALIPLPPIPKYGYLRKWLLRK